MRRGALSLLFLVAACSAPAEAVDATAVGLAEGAITVEHRTLAAGEVSLAIVNNGEYSHTLVVTTGAGNVVAATGLIPPGETVSLPLLLQPGGYQFSCRIVAAASDGSVLDHYQLGMKADVVVRGADS